MKSKPNKRPRRRPRSIRPHPVPPANALLTHIALQSATLDEEQLLGQVLAPIASALSSEVGLAYLVDGDGLTLAAQVGLSERSAQHVSRCGLARGLVGQAFARRESVSVHGRVDVVGSGDGLPDDTLFSAAAAPMVVGPDALGALVISRRRPIPFSQGEVKLLVGIGAQLGVALQLASMRRQLVWRERLAALGELAAVMAHEVRNPLGVIFNALSSLRKLAAPAPAVTTLLDIMSEEADRLNRMIGDLLDFSRPATPSLRAAELEPLLFEVLNAAVPEPAEKGLRVDCGVEKNLPRISMDARLLRQALWNLLQNAVQAMPRGGEIRVCAAVEPPEPGTEPRWVRLDVGDTGPGFSEAMRSRIFQPFFTTKASGTGLGLAVVQRIVEDHQGTISVSSERGVGTTFTLRLLIAKEGAAR